MVMNADGSNIRQAAFAPSGGFCHAAWARDNQLAVNSNAKGLVVGKFDPQNPLDLRKPPGDAWRTLIDTKVNSHNSNPRWAPDGRYLLWSRAGKALNARELFVARAADGAWAPAGPKDLVVGTVDYDWVPAAKKPE